MNKNTNTNSQTPPIKMKRLEQFFLLFLFLCLPMNLASAQSYVAVTADPWYDPTLYPNAPENPENTLYCGEHTRPFPVDWDRDGNMDILASNSDGDFEFCYFHNNGDGTFDAFLNFGGDTAGASTPYVIDWDGDLDLDIILGGGADEIDYCENTGSTGIEGGNVFNCVANYISVTGGLIQPALVDWDKDGFYDIIAGTIYGNLLYLTNNGDNTFTETSSQWQGIDYGRTTSPNVTDIDADGDFDVVVSGGALIVLLENTGDNVNFSYIDDFLSIPMSGTSIRFFNWDNDGHLDFITGNARGYISLYLNDFDEDGYVGEDDADNEDPAVHKDAPEICDGQNNLTGEADSFEIGATGETVATYYQDQDSDTFGNESVSVTACAQPTGYVTNATDCDDTTSEANPNATEVCDGLDNNCDGTVDESSATDASTWHFDADQDGYGNAEISSQSCVAPTNFILADDTKIDCDDNTSELTTTCTDSNDSTNSGDDDNASDADGETSSSSGCGLQRNLQTPPHNHLSMMFFSAMALFFAFRMKIKLRNNMKNKTIRSLKLVSIFIFCFLLNTVSCSSNSSSVQVDEESETSESIDSNDANVDDIVSQASGYYSYSYSDYGSYSCDYGICSKTSTFQDATIFLDKKNNYVFCFDSSSSSTGAYYYDGASDFWSNEGGSASSGCYVGTYSIYSDNTENELDPTYVLSLEIESTSTYLLDTKPEIIGSMEMRYSSGYVSNDDFIMSKSYETEETPNKNYLEFLVAIEEGEVVRYFDQTLVQKKLPGMYHGCLLQYGQAQEPDFEENIYHSIDSYVSNYDYNFEACDQYIFVKINSDHTYQGCIFDSDDIYGHSGEWSIDNDGVLFDPMKFTYSDYEENFESYFSQVSFQNDYDSHFSLNTFSLYTLSISNREPLSWTDADDSLTTPHQDRIDSCLSYLNSDEVEPLVQSLEEKYNEVLSSEADVIEESLVGYYVDRWDSFSNSLNNSELEELDIFINVYAHLDIDEERNFSLEVVYEGDFEANFILEGTVEFNLDNFQEYLSYLNPDSSILFNSSLSYTITKNTFPSYFDLYLRAYADDMFRSYDSIGFNFEMVIPEYDLHFDDSVYF